MTNADQNLEPRVEAVEVDMQELKRSISDLKSTVSTLADVVSLNHEEAVADRAATRERLDRLEAQTRERLDRLETQANADRALMLRLIESIAQGRNGGE